MSRVTTNARTSEKRRRRRGFERVRATHVQLCRAPGPREKRSLNRGLQIQIGSSRAPGHRSRIHEHFFCPARPRRADNSSNSRVHSKKKKYFRNTGMRISVKIIFFEKNDKPLCHLFNKLFNLLIINY